MMQLKELAHQSIQSLFFKANNVFLGVTSSVQITTYGYNYKLNEFNEFDSYFELTVRYCDDFKTFEGSENEIIKQLEEYVKRVTKSARFY